MTKVFGFIPCTHSGAVIGLTALAGYDIVRIILRAFNIDFEGMAITAIQNAFGKNK